MGTLGWKCVVRAVPAAPVLSFWPQSLPPLLYVCQKGADPSPDPSVVTAQRWAWHGDMTLVGLTKAWEDFCWPSGGKLGC